MFTGAVLVVFALPIAFLAWETLANGTETLAIVWSSQTAAPLFRSLLIATSASLGAGLLGTSLAWILVRLRVPAHAWWRVLVPLPLVIPSFVGATAIRFAFGPGGLVPFLPRFEGFWGAWAALVAFTYPYVYLPVAARLQSLPPALEDAARLLGSRAPRIARTVIWPQLRGSITAGMLLVFLYALSDFGAVSIMRYDTLTRAIFSARLAAPTTALTLGFVLAVVALLVAAGERHVTAESDTRSDGRPRSSSPVDSAWLWAVPLAAVGLGLLAPVVAFIVWWLRGSLAAGGGWGALGASFSDLGAAAVNSALAGLVAAAVAAAVLLPVALVAARPRTRVAHLAPVTTSATFALPGLVIAFSIVFWVVRSPDFVFAFYQTFPLLIVAYVIHFGAQALRPMTSAAAALPPALSEAAGTLGAGTWRRLRTIHLPLMTPAITAGAGLVMLSVLKELPATLLLAPPGFQTLATKVWGAAEEGFLADAGAASLALIALSGALSWLVLLRPDPTRR